MNRQNVTEPEEDEGESESESESASGEPEKGKSNPLKIWAKSMLAKTLTGIGR